MKIYYTETEGGAFRRLLEKDICLVVIADDTNKIVANYDAVIKKPRKKLNGEYLWIGIFNCMKSGVAKRSLSNIARVIWIVFMHGLRHFFNTIIQPKKSVAKRRFIGWLRFKCARLMYNLRRFFLIPLSLIWIKYGRHELDDCVHGDCYGFMWLYHAPCCMRFYPSSDFWCYIAKPIEKQ